MKRLSIFACLGFALASPVLGQLVISSLNQNGQLTWTNAVSNANYRVEWANSATGAWHGFELLTNLSSISATSESVTVQVPMFYRVAWTDAPAYAGTYDVQEYDLNGGIIVTGRVSTAGVFWELGSNAFWLARDLFPGPDVMNIADAVAISGHQFGPALWLASGNEGGGYMAWILDNTLEDPVNAVGYLVGNSYFAHWWHLDYEGTMLAVKQNGEAPPLPDPAGLWNYSSEQPKPPRRVIWPSSSARIR